MEGLKTEFARELARAKPIEPVLCRETMDDEGGGLL